MNKINVQIYGGKGLFGGKEQRINIDVAYCDKHDKCSFYKNGTCFNAGRWKSNCKIGKKENIRGFTSRAKGYYEFYNKWKNDELYNKLREPNCSVGIVDDIVLINIPWIKVEEDLTISQPFNDYISYIPLLNFDNEMIKKICDFVPRTLFENAPIKDYLDKKIPNFLIDLKYRFNDIYNNFIKEYPQYEKLINFIGKKAYIRSIKNGTKIVDNKKEYLIDNGYLICEEYSHSFMPFNSRQGYFKLKIEENMLFEISDNSQVDENTIFDC